MTPEFFIDLAARTLRTALLLAAPPLLAGLLIGVFVSIIQTVMQIQEQTLVLIPKLLAVVVVLLLFLPWMLEILLSFTQFLFLHIPEYVR
jgi:flagellar biosynthetic protein FliQ